MDPFLGAAVFFAVCAMLLLRFTTTNLAPAICAGGALAFLLCAIYLGGHS
jgi:hypothetical protein